MAADTVSGALSTLAGSDAWRVGYNRCAFVQGTIGESRHCRKKARVYTSSQVGWCYEHAPRIDAKASKKFAFADPPYLGCCSLYNHDHLPILGQQLSPKNCWDEPDVYRLFIESLTPEYPDGWALCASSTSLRTLLPFCPPDVRVAAWVKPFAAFKRNVRNAYTWEAVILHGGRLSSRDGAPVSRDHLAESITLRKGLTGAKPVRFCQWVLDMLGFVQGDEIDDLFRGTNVMAAVLSQQRLAGVP